MMGRKGERKKAQQGSVQIRYNCRHIIIYTKSSGRNVHQTVRSAIEIHIWKHNSVLKQNTKQACLQCETCLRWSEQKRQGTNPQAFCGHQIKWILPRTLQNNTQTNKWAIQKEKQQHKRKITVVIKKTPFKTKDKATKKEGIKQAEKQHTNFKEMKDKNNELEKLIDNMNKTSRSSKDSFAAVQMINKFITKNF